jgi:hypothetical protein
VTLSPSSRLLDGGALRALERAEELGYAALALTDTNNLLFTPVEIVLKGKEGKLPNGASFRDKD